MSAKTTARRCSDNLAPTMRKQFALTLRECRLSLPIERPWGPAYRMVEWATKNDSDVHRRAFPADCTPSQIAAALRAHVPGRRYGPHDDDPAD